MSVGAIKAIEIWILMIQEGRTIMTQEPMCTGNPKIMCRVILEELIRRLIKFLKVLIE